ncbi:MAG: hypothetical protein M5U14_06805 [Acidimicrobiia bacterium]|nr:hypothetical protein [Acidimicrobiia bacterium]
MEQNRRLPVVLGVGAAALALLLVLRFVVLSDGGDDEHTTTPTTEATLVTTAPAETATTAPGELPPETFEVFATRNPFAPVVQITPVTVPTFTPTTTPGFTTTPTFPGGTVTPTTGAPTVTVTPTTPTTVVPSQEPVAAQAVALLDVFDQDGTATARVRVGSTVYTVVPGQTFATSYQLVSLTDRCGQFLFGDSPFSLCEGEEVIK